MDETDNKKRRNLMFTACVVLASAFLELKLPSTLLTTWHLTEEVNAWKVWFLVTVVLAYQLWRFSTDTTKIARPSKAALDEQRRRIMTSALIWALRKQQKNERHYGVQLEVPGHVSKPLNAGAFRVFGLQNGAASNLDISSLQGVAQFHWVERNERGDGEASANCVYQFHPLLYWWHIVRAVVRALIRSPHLQDGLVPIGLGSWALGFSFARTAELWLAR